jgi:GTP-binding protein EngB required for normal cell division
MNNEKKEIRKNYKTFLRNLLFCLIIKSVLENRITLSEVYEIIDKIADSKRKEKLEKEKEKRQNQIEIENERFKRIAERSRQGIQNNNSEYKSYFSVDSVD